MFVHGMLMFYKCVIIMSALKSMLHFSYCSQELEKLHDNDCVFTILYSLDIACYVIHYYLPVALFFTFHIHRIANIW